jgi:hypothetical protein
MTSQRGGSLTVSAKSSEIRTRHNFFNIPFSFE